MKNLDFTAAFYVEQKPNAVVNAIKNFRAWWSEDIEGNTDQLNDLFFYHYKDIHLCKIKLVEEIENSKLVYLVVDNQFSFTKDKSEWVDTKLIFDISLEDHGTKVNFTHQGLVPSNECYSICEDAWGNYIKKSLFDLINTGKGQPNPKEKDGFNAQIVEKWKLG